MFASMFVQGAEGATFAFVPLINHKIQGKTAGMAGAYGNVALNTYRCSFFSNLRKSFS